MNVAAFYSGGKDSTYSIYLAQKQGHKVLCLLTLFPKSDESHLLHHPNISWTSLQSKSMNIPQLSISSNSDNTDEEVSLLEKLMKIAKKKFPIEGIVHGGIKSKFQKEKFNSLCSSVNLTSIAPLWDLPPEQYMLDLLNSNFIFIITSVSSGGLDDAWLGKTIGKPDIEILKKLSSKFGFNLNFEGGEAETFVIDCPLFSTPVQINKSVKNWDGYRGRFEIVDANLK